MSAPKEVAVGGTVYFWFAANTTQGSAGDGATPLYDVRLAGAAAGAAPTASGTPTLLTHANYSDGLYEIAIDATGYAAGEYAVFCTLTISSVNPAGFVGSFKVPGAEPGQGAPPAVATTAQKIDYLYKAWRNRSTMTASQYSLYADDGTTVDQKAAASDDLTTFDRNEIGSGP